MQRLKLRRVIQGLTCVLGVGFHGIVQEVALTCFVSLHGGITTLFCSCFGFPCDGSLHSSLTPSSRGNIDLSCSSRVLSSSAVFPLCGCFFPCGTMLSCGCRFLR